jgi:ubiquinone/menaquinone biosynthesis C-methylase UbiE
MNSKARPFLDFYEKHGIIPTNLNIESQPEFFLQRDRLFASLGVPPILLRDKNIFELGPGTGQKATHLLSMHPMSYLAVENNSMSLKATKAVIESSKFSGNAEVKDQDFLTYESLTHFDLVLAELVLSTQSNPEKFLKKLLEITIDQGILVVTCCDPISMLSETLRKAITFNENLIDGDLKSSAIRIASFFKQDLDHLKGMNRVRTDWAIDQLINPWIGPLLSIPDAIAHLGTAAVFHGSSPRFVEDYRWYKDPELSVTELNKDAIQNYWEKCHNFLDSRLPRSTRDTNINKSLYQLCNELYLEVYTTNWSNDSHSRVLEICLNLKAHFIGLGELINNSLDDFIDYWQSGSVASLQEFRPFWGRGTQYISFIKSCAPRN